MFSTGNPFDVYNLPLIFFVTFQLPNLPGSIYCKAGRIPNFFFFFPVPYTTSKYFPMLSLYLLSMLNSSGSLEEIGIERNCCYLCHTQTVNLNFQSLCSDVFHEWCIHFKEGWVNVQEKGFSFQAHFEPCMLFLRKISYRSQHPISF